MFLMTCFSCPLFWWQQQSKHIISLIGRPGGMSTCVWAEEKGKPNWFSKLTVFHGEPEKISILRFEGVWPGVESFWWKPNVRVSHMLKKCLHCSLLMKTWHHIITPHTVSRVIQTKTPDTRCGHFGKIWFWHWFLATMKTSLNQWRPSVHTSYLSRAPRALPV